MQAQLIHVLAVPRQLDAARLAWFHVPKTGSSFVNTIFTHSCPALPPDVYLDLGLQSTRSEVFSRPVCRPGFQFSSASALLHRSIAGAVNNGSCNSPPAEAAVPQPLTSLQIVPASGTATRLMPFSSSQHRCHFV